MPHQIGSVETCALDEHHLQNLRLAQEFTAQNKDKHRAIYKYRVLNSGTEVIIKYVNDKNSQGMAAKVLTDSGGATVLVKLENRSRPIRVHKGHTYLIKGSTEYNRFFAPGSKSCIRREYLPEDNPVPDPTERRPPEKSTNLGHRATRYNLRSRKILM